ncbi:MAG: hypothetical protein AB7T63_00495 [Planctomycetota bacterium]
MPSRWTVLGVLVLTLAVCSSTTRVAAADEPLDRAGLLRRDLASSEAKTVAWAGWLLAGDPMPELVPDMLAALDRWADVRGKHSFLARRHLMDVLILLDADVPTPLLLRLAEADAIPTLLLASAPGREHPEVLLRILELDTAKHSMSETGVAAGNLLATRRHEGFMAHVLPLVTPELAIYVEDSEGLGGWGGIAIGGSGCAHVTRSWDLPPRPNYDLLTKKPLYPQGWSRQVAPGRERSVWAVRRVERRRAYWVGARNKLDDPTRLVLGWAADLLGTPAEELPLRPWHSATVTWTEGPAYVVAVTEERARMKDRIHALVLRLVQAGFLRSEQARTIRIVPVVEARDRRIHDDTPLPEIDGVRVRRR